ncbi:ATP-dependent RNA helicase HrpA [Phycisphaerales bacterium]|nr:ATP-dependent RNA helicase HrpA [Phycisphaerales bacterium]
MPRTHDPNLPILLRRADIEAAVRAHQIVVICGETGSGKTTQLPQICVGLGLHTSGMIGHTQPRRIAARAVAARIAEEMGVALGGRVGYKVRFDDKTSRDTAIKVMTDGILLAELAGEPTLRAYSTIILDEAHERSLNIDFLLGYLRTLLPRRPDLRVIVTSATIDPKRFSEYFGGPGKAPVIEVSGRVFPVEVRYHDTDADEENFERMELDAVADAVEDLAGPRSGEGDILVFLPGEREIRLAADQIRRRGVDAEILPLFSRLTSQEQDRIFHLHPAGRQRVILATNIAETSLTVPGIRYVVDSGLVRLTRYDPQRKIQRLPIERVSQASANQRSGRCGRVAAGVCIRLYAKSALDQQPKFTDPEIRRANLAGVILQMKALRLPPIENFPFLDPPDAAAIHDGYETLFELGALGAASAEGALTPVGEHLARLPLDPRLGRMLLAAEGERSLAEVLVLAALLSIQDPRQRPMDRQEEADRAQLVFRHESSDFMTALKLWDQYRHAAGTLGSGESQRWCREHFLSAARMREWTETHRQLASIAEDLRLAINAEPATEDAIHRALLTGLISNVACRDAAGGSFDYKGVRGNTVSLFPGSVLFKKGPKWIMAAEVVQTTRLYARTAARIEPEWIEELAGHMFRHQLSDRHFDAETGEPSAWERVTMNGIVVVPRRRAALARHDPAAARRLFVSEGLAQGKWGGEYPFLAHNRAVLDAASTAEAKLRRRGLAADVETIAAWFESRIPASVRDPASFAAWHRTAAASNPRLLHLSPADVLKPEAASAGDPALFPGTLALSRDGEPVPAPLTYAWTPGKDEDGVTVTLGLTDLPLLTPARSRWLVPGSLPDLFAALIKGLPKGQQAALAAKASIPEMAAACAQVVEFGTGDPGRALSEALDALYSVRIEPGAWAFAGLPAHLRLRVRVLDETGKEIAAGRDVAALHTKLAARIEKAAAKSARAQFERTGLTAWDFGDLPERVEVERAGETVGAYPTLIDHRASVTLTLLDSREAAARETFRGVRRLFALACREEVQHHLAAFEGWSDMARHYSALGPAEELRDEITCLVAERAFLASGATPRTRAEFDALSQANWGKLAAACREVCDVVSRILEPRFRLAHRLSGGTSRNWAASVADIREHAAYLMPRGFLALVPWERLRHYPRYVTVMRERLFGLREGGSHSETAALQAVLPHWKRFTGWVARAMSAQRERAAELEEAAAKSARTAKSPLPQARRAAPTVNLDAGEWAITPGNLPKAVEEYRWALEELRAAAFGPQPPKGAPGVGDLDSLWKRADAAT